jgi:hypothetical protein
MASGREYRYQLSRNNVKKKYIILHFYFESQYDNANLNSSGLV